MDLSSMISKSSSECLNESDDHKLEHCLSNKGGYLESDCDEQVTLADIWMFCIGIVGARTMPYFYFSPFLLEKMFLKIFFKINMQILNIWVPKANIFYYLNYFLDIL